MPEITSIRHLWKFYLTLFVWLSFCLLMALFLGALAKQGPSQGGGIVLIVMSAGMLCLALFIVIRYYKNAPNIVVDSESISFNHEVYYWKDLEKIEMTGKRSFKFMGEKKEGVLFKFKGQEERYIFDDMYENSAEIKSFIQSIVFDKKAPEGMKKPDDVIKTDIEASHPAVLHHYENKPIVNLNKESVETATPIVDDVSDASKYYKGNPLLSFQGILLWSLVVFFLCIGVLDFKWHHHRDVFAMVISLSIFAFILLSTQMHYFAIKGECLIIKNYNFLWVKRVYDLKDIREVVFEPGKSRLATNTLRIIMNDFTSKTYPAGTLRDKKWMQLKEDLEKQGIKVRNECINYEPFEFKFFND